MHQDMCTEMFCVVSDIGRGDDVSAIAGVLSTSFAHGGNQIQVTNTDFS